MPLIRVAALIDVGLVRARAILGKLGVHSRAEAATEAVRLGLLES